MGDIKKLTEEHYRIGFRNGLVVASILWAILLLSLSYYVRSEYEALFNQCKTMLNECYESQ